MESHRDGKEKAPEAGSRASTWILCGIAGVGVAFLLIVFCLADSFFSWGIMPEGIERWAHRWLVDLVPME